MAGENEAVVIDQQEQSEEEAIASFNAGAQLRNTEPTTQPTPTPTPDPVAAVAEPASKEPDAPKPFTVTEQDWNELRAKATAIDEIKAEHKRQLDTLNGNMGGLKQQVEQMRQRGVKLTPGALKRVAEHYPELEPILAEDLNELLSAPQGTTLDAEEIDKRVKAALEVALPAEAVKLEKKILRLHHADWEEVLRSDDFKAYQTTLPPAENQKLMDSTDGEYIAGHITAAKKAKEAKAAAQTVKPAATPAPSPAPSARQARIESAVPAKGTGGGAPAPDPADDFNAGWKLKGTT